MRLVTNEDGSRSVILETHECYNCSGTCVQRNYRSCPRYNLAQRGKPCQHCGSTTKNHNNVRIPDSPCTRCNATGSVPETDMDYIPRDWWPNELEFRVVERTNRAADFNESYLGFGYIYTSQDYGQSKSWSDEQLIAKVKEHTSVQLTSILARERKSSDDLRDLTLAPYIEIIRRADGYNVRAHR